MTDNKNALRLAGEVDEAAKVYPDLAEVSAMLRSQHARIAELEAELAEQCRINAMGAERELSALNRVRELEAVARVALQTLEGWSNHGAWVWPESALEQAKRNTVEAIESLRKTLGEA